jgi:hypothetical protein
MNSDPARCIADHQSGAATESQEVSPGIVLDFNERNPEVRAERLNLSQQAPSLHCREWQSQTASTRAHPPIRLLRWAVRLFCPQ